MKRRLIAGFIGSLFLLPVSNASADAGHGKALHDAKCGGCHGTQMYTRPNRKIHSLQALHDRVEFCDNASKAGFDAADRAAVVEYLNRDFYKFPDIR